MASEKSTAKKTLSVIGNIFIWLFIAFAVVVTILAFASQNKEHVPSIGGKVILKVQTESMSPVYEPGDMIVGKKLDLEQARSLEVGDIITFMTQEYVNGQLVDMLKTHRIIEVVKDENGIVEGYFTQGDHNSEPDMLTTNTGGVRTDENGDPILHLADCPNIICYHGNEADAGTRIPALGSVIDFLNTSTGFLVCVVIPLVIFFIFELISFIRKFMALKNEGKKQISAADEEEIKQRAVAEYLKQQAEKEAAEKAADAATEEATAEEAADAAADSGQQTADSEVSEETAEEAPAEEATAEEAPAEKAEETAEEAPAEATEEASSEEPKTEE